MCLLPVIEHPGEPTPARAERELSLAARVDAYEVLPGPGKRPSVAVVSGVLERECRDIIQEFFRRRRQEQKG